MRTILAAVLVAFLAGCASGPAQLSGDQVAAIVAAPDRSEADRVNDRRRKAVEMLAFIDARPGMLVLDMGAGGGYTTELLARAVGPKGRVHAQNSGYWMETFVKTRFTERMQSPAMGNVTLNVLPFDNPIPKEVKPGTLDLVTFLFNYHDMGWAGTDRARMNKAVFDALKPGGTYVIADHSGRPGTGISESKSLHRIEESFLRRELEAAGFRLVAEASFLRNPGDPRDKSVFKPAQPNDEFVLKFRKPD